MSGKQNKLCESFQKGSCYRGVNCSFLHVNMSAALGEKSSISFVKTATLTANELGEFTKESKVEISEEDAQDMAHPDLVSGENVPQLTEQLFVLSLLIPLHTCLHRKGKTRDEVAVRTASQCPR
jgi:hypothetical protein